jgi:hypothetical protein
MGNLIQTIFLGAVRHSRFVTDIRKAIDREAKVRESGPARPEPRNRPIGSGLAHILDSPGNDGDVLGPARVVPARQARQLRPMERPARGMVEDRARQPGPSSGSR